MAACFERAGGTAPLHDFDDDGVCRSCGTTREQHRRYVEQAQGARGVEGCASQTLPFAALKLRIAAGLERTPHISPELSTNEAAALLDWIAFLSDRAGVGAIGAPGHFDPVGAAG